MHQCSSHSSNTSRTRETSTNNQNVKTRSQRESKSPSPSSKRQKLEINNESSPESSRESSTAPTEQIYIFGYGSLISASSRARTVEGYQNIPHVAVRCHGLKRMWCLPSSGPLYTALGCIVEPSSIKDDQVITKFCCCGNVESCCKESKENCDKSTTNCCSFIPSVARQEYPHRLDHLNLPKCDYVVNGVIFPIGNEHDLQKFDIRESGYARIRLDPRQIQTLGLSDYENGIPGQDLPGSTREGDEGYQQAMLWKTNPEKATVYAYVLSEAEELDTISPTPPSLRHPLAQTYIDVCMRGCLSYSREFAEEFVAQTWFATTEMLCTCPSKVHAGNICHSCNGYFSENGVSMPWVNDRAHARYRRAENMDEKVWKQIDDILEKVLGIDLDKERQEGPVKRESN